MILIQQIFFVNNYIIKNKKYSISLSIEHNFFSITFNLFPTNDSIFNYIIIYQIYLEIMQYFLLII